MLRRALQSRQTQHTATLSRVLSLATGYGSTISSHAGTRFDDPLALVVQHVFNHGTHHRGQMSAAISGYGHVGPEMDLIFYLRGAGQVLPTV